jgi:hypothetical protein
VTRKFLPRKKSSSLVPKQPSLRLHRVNDHEQIRREQIAFLRRIFFDLRRRTRLHAILDGQRMKMENLLQHFLPFRLRGIFQIHPEKKVRVREQRRHQKNFDVLRMEFALRRECE